MTEYRALGTAITFTSATDISLSMVLTGTGTATINSSDSAFLQIPANSTWRLPDLCNYVCDKTREWIFAAITADGGVTKSSFVETDFSVTFSFSPSTTINGSLLTFKITNSAGAHLKIGGTNVSLTSVTLTNTNGLWTKFGLDDESTTSIAMTVGSNIATKVGEFQPRSIFVFLRSEVDGGDTEEAVLYKALKISDGTITTYESGRHIAKRQLRLVDLDESFCGRPVAAARLNATGISSQLQTNINATSSVFTVAGNNEITNLYWRADLDVSYSGRFYLVAGLWCGRATSDLDVPTGFAFVDKVPASITAANATVLVISEAHALFFEALRTGYLFVFDVVETPGSAFGSLLWIGEDYCIDPEHAVFEPERRDAGLPVYSYTFHLLRRDVSGITQASN